MNKLRQKDRTKNYMIAADEVANKKVVTITNSDGSGGCGNSQWECFFSV